MRIGFFINPIAGMGGRVGLKGTDGVHERAVALGATPVAAGKAAQMLALLHDALERQQPDCWIEWFTCSGAMGEEALRSAGFNQIQVVHQAALSTSANDTATAIRAFLQFNVDLVVFCGGDGTARDIAEITSGDVPILGIPAGVKMYSGVFGVTAEKTAELIIGFICGEIPVVAVDVLDLDEERYRQDQWAVRLFYSALTPFEPNRTQVAKALISESSDAAVKAEIADEFCEYFRADPKTLWLLGPGSTVQTIAESMGIKKTLLGIDALVGGQLVGRDLNETGILALLEKYPSVRLIVSPIGAQGFVLGRGNLQISPEIVRRIGLDNILAVATPAKLQRTPLLRFDTGDSTLDAAFRAKHYMSVVTGYRRRRMTPISV